jgi:hypothetical protein
MICAATLVFAITALFGTSTHAAVLVAEEVRSASPTYISLPPCSATALPIANPGFDSGKLGPWKLIYPRPLSPRLTNYTVVPRPHISGGYALRIDEYPAAYKPQPYINQGNFAVCPGYQYRVAGDYQVVQAIPGALLLLGPSAHYEADLAESCLGEVYLNETSTSWLNTSILCDFLTNTEVPFAVRIFGYVKPGKPYGPSVLVDNLSMVPVKSLVAPTCPEEPGKIANGHFQTGELAPWQVTTGPGELTYAIVPSNTGFNSSYALRFTYNASATEDGPQITHNFGPVCYGYVYVFEVEYNVITPVKVVPNPKYPNQWQRYMDFCVPFNVSGHQYGPKKGPLQWDRAGRGTIKTLCRILDYGTKLFDLQFSTYDSGPAVVDILGFNVRLATTDDLGS